MSDLLQQLGLSIQGFRLGAEEEDIVAPFIFDNEGEEAVFANVFSKGNVSAMAPYSLLKKSLKKGVLPGVLSAWWSVYGHGVESQLKEGRKRRKYVTLLSFHTLVSVLNVLNDAWKVKLEEARREAREAAMARALARARAARRRGGGGGGGDDIHQEVDVEADAQEEVARMTLKVDEPPRSQLHVELATYVGRVLARAKKRKALVTGGGEVSGEVDARVVVDVCFRADTLLLLLRVAEMDDLGRWTALALGQGGAQGGVRSGSGGRTPPTSASGSLTNPPDPPNRAPNRFTLPLPENDMDDEAEAVSGASRSESPLESPASIASGSEDGSESNPPTAPPTRTTSSSSRTHEVGAVAPGAVEGAVVDDEYTLVLRELKKHGFGHPSQLSGCAMYLLSAQDYYGAGTMSWADFVGGGKGKRRKPPSTTGLFRVVGGTGGGGGGGGEKRRKGKKKKEEESVLFGGLAVDGIHPDVVGAGLVFDPDDLEYAVQDLDYYRWDADAIRYVALSLCRRPHGVPETWMSLHVSAGALAAYARAELQELSRLTERGLWREGVALSDSLMIWVDKAVDKPTARVAGRGEDALEIVRLRLEWTAKCAARLSGEAKKKWDKMVSGRGVGGVGGSGARRKGPGTLRGTLFAEWEKASRQWGWSSPHPFELSLELSHRLGLGRDAVDFEFRVALEVMRFFMTRFTRMPGGPPVPSLVCVSGVGLAHTLCLTRRSALEDTEEGEVAVVALSDVLGHGDLLAGSLGGDAVLMDGRLDVGAMIAARRVWNSLTGHPEFLKGAPACGSVDLVWGPRQATQVLEVLTEVQGVEWGHCVSKVAFVVVTGGDSEGQEEETETSGSRQRRVSGRVHGVRVKVLNLETGVYTVATGCGMGISPDEPVFVGQVWRSVPMTDLARIREALDSSLKRQLRILTSAGASAGQVCQVLECIALVAGLALCTWCPDVYAELVFGAPAAMMTPRGARIRTGLIAYVVCVGLVVGDGGVFRVRMEGSRDVVSESLLFQTLSLVCGPVVWTGLDKRMDMGEDRVVRRAVAGVEKRPSVPGARPSGLDLKIELSDQQQSGLGRQDHRWMRVRASPLWIVSFIVGWARKQFVCFSPTSLSSSGTDWSTALSTVWTKRVGGQQVVDLATRVGSSGRGGRDTVVSTMVVEPLAEEMTGTDEDADEEGEGGGEEGSEEGSAEEGSEEGSEEGGTGPTTDGPGGKRKRGDQPLEGSGERSGARSGERQKRQKPLPAPQQ